MKATVSVTHRGTAAACCFVNNSIQKHRKRERNKFHMLQMNKKSAPRERGKTDCSRSILQKEIREERLCLLSSGS